MNPYILISFFLRHCDGQEMTEIFGNIRSYIFEELSRDERDNISTLSPIEMAFKSSAILHRHLHPLLHAASSSTLLQKHRAFLMDTLHMVSTLLSECLVIKSRSESSVTKVPMYVYPHFSISYFLLIWFSIMLPRD